MAEIESLNPRVIGLHLDIQKRKLQEDRENYIAVDLNEMAQERVQYSELL
jgi:hypothetical protein